MRAATGRRGLAGGVALGLYIALSITVLPVSIGGIALIVLGTLVLVAAVVLGGMGLAQQGRPRAGVKLLAGVLCLLAGIAICAAGVAMVVRKAG